MENPRFKVLLGGKGTPQVADYDRPLLSRTDWLVAPTLGAIVPNWLLLIPRHPALNFQAWSKLRGQAPELLLQAVREHLGLDNDEIIWFEHGPCTAGTPIGCGTDYAHIHILIRPHFSFAAFADKAKSLSGLKWIRSTSEDAYQEILNGHSYLIAGSGDQTVISHDVEATGSQFFRRVVSMLANAEETWDYRQSPHTANITKTIRSFRLLESAAQRAE